MLLSNALEIAGFVALIVFIFAAIYLIIKIGSVARTINDVVLSLNTISNKLVASLDLMSKDVHELKVKVVDSLDSVDVASKQLAVSIKNIETQANSAFNTFKPIEELVNMIYSRVYSPVNYTTAVVSGASKAISAFVNVLSNKKKK